MYKNRLIGLHFYEGKWIGSKYLGYLEDAKFILYTIWVWVTSGIKVPTWWYSTAQGTKRPTISLDSFQEQIIGYVGCIQWSYRLPYLKSLDIFCENISKREYMKPLHHYCKNFETVLLMLVPGCHLPCFTMCSEKCSTMPSY